MQVQGPEKMDSFKMATKSCLQNNINVFELEKTKVKNDFEEY